MSSSLSVSLSPLEEDPSMIGPLSKDRGDGGNPLGETAAAAAVVSCSESLPMPHAPSRGEAVSLLGDRAGEPSINAVSVVGSGIDRPSDMLPICGGAGAEVAAAADAAADAAAGSSRLGRCCIGSKSSPSPKTRGMSR